MPLRTRRSTASLPASARSSSGCLRRPRATLSFRSVALLAPCCSMGLALSTPAIHTQHGAAPQPAAACDTACSSAAQVLCELIATMAFDPIEDVRADALFRSGPAPFTDIVLRHALQNPLSLRPNPHRLRILPRVALGGLPSGFHGVSTWNEPHRLAVHWSLGSWKSVDYNNKRAFTELDRRRAMLLLRPPSKADLGLRLYPVSSLTQPPFTLMTHLIGQGDLQVRSTSGPAEGFPVLSLSSKLAIRQCREASRSGPSFLHSWRGTVGLCKLAEASSTPLQRWNKIASMPVLFVACLT